MKLGLISLLLLLFNTYYIIMKHIHDIFSTYKIILFWDLLNESQNQSVKKSGHTKCLIKKIYRRTLVSNKKYAAQIKFSTVNENIFNKIIQCEIKLN